MANPQKPVIGQVIDERGQSHETRKVIISKLEKAVGRPVVSLFTSFKYPVILSDDDADMLEAILQTMNLQRGFALLLSSPGGSGLAAGCARLTCTVWWAIWPPDGHCWSGAGRDARSVKIGESVFNLYGWCSTRALASGAALQRTGFRCFWACADSSGGFFVGQ